MGLGWRGGGGLWRCNCTGESTSAWHLFLHVLSLKVQVIQLMKLVQLCSPGGTKLNVQVPSANKEGPSMA